MKLVLSCFVFILSSYSLAIEINGVVSALTSEEVRVLLDNEAHKKTIENCANNLECQIPHYEVILKNTEQLLVNRFHSRSDELGKEVIEEYLDEKFLYRYDKKSCDKKMVYIISYRNNECYVENISEFTKIQEKFLENELKYAIKKHSD